MAINSNSKLVIYDLLVSFFLLCLSQSQPCFFLFVPFPTVLMDSQEQEELRGREVKHGLQGKIKKGSSSCSKPTDCIS